MENDTKQDEITQKMAAGIAAGVAAVDFLVEIAEALGLDPQVAHIDMMLERIAELRKIERDGQ